ncbi:MAG: BrnA antitoxin family protein [Pyrinomonadaceae bacterium]
MKKENNNSDESTRRRFRRVRSERVASEEDMRPSNTKVKVSMYLDLDVLNYFKERAAQPNAAAYQTQINNELRAIMERDGGDPYAELVNDERFIAAVAARVKRA